MKMKNIALSIAAVSVLSIPALADSELGDLRASGEVKVNYGIFTNDGTSYNNTKSHVAEEPYRSDVTAKLFLNQEVGEVTSWHSELQLNKDWSAVQGYDDTRINSQYDWLRELYVDTAFGDNLTLRVGKQQVVWGKADGVKFLDIINPTDFRHWGQDSMADSRIPLWMINAEYLLNENGNSLQVVYVPQVNVTNQIPGLYNPQTGDAGQPFIPMGMDTMLGQTNGFLHIGTEMGSVAGAFGQAFSVGMTGSTASTSTILGGFTTMSVEDFTKIPDVGAFIYSQNGNVAANVNALGLSANGGGDGFAVLNGNQMLSNTVHLAAPNGIGATTNLFGQTLNTSNPTTMFDYMADTSFATFNSFIGMGTKYVKKHADNKIAKGNIGVRYSASTEGGLNYTLNYYYHYDNNPVVDISWEGADGSALESYTTSATLGANTYKTVHLRNTVTKADYNATAAGGAANMVFTETQNRINTFGASFDYAIDTSFAPIIVRSEMVYDKGTLQPIVNRGALAYGDFDNAFTVQKADFFNYVIGLDVTVMTNLFVSFQFMDKWNLDYKDTTSTWTGPDGTKTYGVYTANPATMSLSNQFKKAEEHQIMYTLYLSKPFLESDALRVNNLFLLENDNGGYWDRVDFEYSYSDNLILTGSYNRYGGDRNGVFGQFEDESNAQLGFKYIF